MMLYRWHRQPHYTSTLPAEMVVGAIRAGLRYVQFARTARLEHLRQHERVTVADRAIRDQVLALHHGSEPPIVSHMIYAARR